MKEPLAILTGLASVLVLGAAGRETVRAPSPALPAQRELDDGALQGDWKGPLAGSIRASEGIANARQESGGEADAPCSHIADTLLARLRGWSGAEPV